MEQPPQSNTDVNTAAEKPVETKEFVTPYAFGVADSLIGTPLATPTQRGIAQVIDLVCVGLLSTLSGWFLALITSFTFFRASRQLDGREKRTFTRRLLRVGATLLLFIGTLMAVNALTGEDTSSGSTEESESSSDVAMAIVKGSHALAWSQCEDMPCKMELAESIGSGLAEQGMEEQAFLNYINQFLADVDADPEQRQQLRSAYKEAFDNSDYPSESSAESTDEPGVVLRLNEDSDEAPQSSKDSGDTAKADDTIVDYIQDIASEWGVSLGWAALYYSVFTAWFNGRTPGKKLMNIRVLKLDGQPLSLWDSFGRYGGYSAGLATGLSGFLQIYWDPNRQSIQDKISETVVIKVT